MKGDLGSLVGKEVEILANGTIYRGKLIEVGIAFRLKGNKLRTTPHQIPA